MMANNVQGKRIVEQAVELSAAAVSLPGDDLLVIEYLDARGTDGNARKYRVMMIGGRIYPLHLAISGKWKVHYFTSDMADKPDHRLEDARFLAAMPAAPSPAGPRPSPSTKLPTPSPIAVPPCASRTAS